MLTTVGGAPVHGPPEGRNAAGVREFRGIKFKFAGSQPRMMRAAPKDVPGEAPQRCRKHRRHQRSRQQK